MSHVPSQPEVIPSSSSMLSRDKRLPFDTWNSPGLQENVFGNQCSKFDSPRDHPQGIHQCAPKRERGSGTLFASDDEQNKGTIPMPMFARRPLTMSSSILVEVPQKPVFGPQRQQISELQFDKCPAPHSFLLEDTIGAKRKLS